MNLGWPNLLGTARCATAHKRPTCLLHLSAILHRHLRTRGPLGWFLTSASASTKRAPAAAGRSRPIVGPSRRWYAPSVVAGRRLGLSTEEYRMLTKRPRPPRCLRRSASFTAQSMRVSYTMAQRGPCRSRWHRGARRTCARANSFGPLRSAPPDPQPGHACRPDRSGHGRDLSAVESDSSSTCCRSLLGAMLPWPWGTSWYRWSRLRASTTSCIAFVQRRGRHPRIAS